MKKYIFISIFLLILGGLYFYFIILAPPILRNVRDTHFTFTNEQLNDAREFLNHFFRTERQDLMNYVDGWEDSRTGNRIIIYLSDYSAHNVRVIRSAMSETRRIRNTAIFEFMQSPGRPNPAIFYD